MTKVTRLGNFLPIWQLLEAYYGLKNDLVAQRNGNILGYFLFKQNEPHFKLVFLVVSEHGLL
jgi:hypothetical protein